MGESHATGPPGSPRRFPQARFAAPPGSCELLLVRHGQSEDALEGAPFSRFEGHADPPLSPLGRAQAERLCERLAAEHVDAVYVTPLRRTAETAAPLAARLGVEPVVERDLREIYLGEWEGWVFEQKFVDRDPLALQMVREQRWDLAPGSEPVGGFASRVRAGIERIATGHPDQRVVVVAHGGTIGEVLAQAHACRSVGLRGGRQCVAVPCRGDRRPLGDPSVQRHHPSGPPADRPGCRPALSAWRARPVRA